jgi:hypothetical protein
MEFRASEIDTVVRELLECKGWILDLDFQAKHLPDWQILKVKAIFKYLVEHHDNMFEQAGYRKDDQQYGLYMGIYKTQWEADMQKGGFTAFWKKKEDFKASLLSVMNGANIGASVVKTLVDLVDQFV